LLHEVRTAAVLRGTFLDPVPTKASKHDEVRYLDIHEDDGLDEDQLVSWIEQPATCPARRCDDAGRGAPCATAAARSGIGTSPIIIAHTRL
jgi:hypothetical protein